MKIRYIVLYSLIFSILLFSVNVYATEAIFVWSHQSRTLSTSTSEARLLENKTGNFLELKSGAAVLMEQNTGKILYEHNSHEQLRPASVTKVMSLLLIMESLDSGKISLEDKVPCSENAASMGGSQIWLDVREELSVHEMLKAISVVSANDCTIAMAEYLEGSESLFVEKMNQRARELGMKDTVFKNCHGIDEDGHVTTAYDIALMSRELMLNHPKISEYTTIWMDSLRDGKSELVNTNRLVRNYTGTTGLKTGSTSVALYNLSATATRDDLSLIATIMKAETTDIRFSEAQKLLDYGFSNYAYKEFGKQGDKIDIINVDKGVQKTVDVIYDSAAGSLIKKGQEKDVQQVIELERNVSAPVLEGQKVGVVKYTLNGEMVGEVNLVAQKEVKKSGIINMTSHIYQSWFNVLR